MSSEIIIASISVISVVIGAILGFWLSLKRDGIHRKRRVLHLLHVAREEARMNEQLMRYNPLNRLKKHDEMEYFLHPYLPQCDYCSSLLESSDLLGFISESDINLLIAYGRFVEKAKHCWKQYETLLPAPEQPAHFTSSLLRVKMSIEQDLMTARTAISLHSNYLLRALGDMIERLKPSRSASELARKIPADVEDAD